MIENEGVQEVQGRDLREEGVDRDEIERPRNPQSKKKQSRKRPVEGEGPQKKKRKTKKTKSPEVEIAEENPTEDIPEDIPTEVLEKEPTPERVPTPQEIIPVSPPPLKRLRKGVSPHINIIKKGSTQEITYPGPTSVQDQPPEDLFAAGHTDPNPILQQRVFTHFAPSSSSNYVQAPSALDDDILSNEVFIEEEEEEEVRLEAC